LRAGLWRWVLALIFAGYLAHAALCPCEVAHPHEHSPKTAIVSRVHRVLAGIVHRAAARLSGHSDAAPLRLVLLAHLRFIPSTARVAISHLLFVLTTPLLARGPPPTATACIHPGTL
jgi:hypothetical protein